MLWFLLIARTLAIEPVHVQLAGADTASALRFLANVGDINFIAGAPPSSGPIFGGFTTPTVRELFDMLAEAQGYRSGDSAGLVVLSGKPLERALSSGPYSGRKLHVDVEGVPFVMMIGVVGDQLECTPLVTWSDVDDRVTTRLKDVPADQALDALLAIEAETGICTPGGFLDRSGTGTDHRLASAPAGAYQPEPAHLPSGVTLRRRGRTWLIDAPPAEIKATRRLIREGRQDPWPTMDTDGPGWLQGYPLHRLNLVGTAITSGEAAALIVDPSGMGHTVMLGTYVGRNWGRVTAIAATSITVTEEYRTPEGELVTNTIVMQLGQLASPAAGG